MRTFFNHCCCLHCIKFLIVKSKMPCYKCFKYVMIAAMIKRQWWKCDDITAMIKLRWYKCDDKIAMIPLRWSYLSPSYVLTLIKQKISYSLVIDTFRLTQFKSLTLIMIDLSINYWNWWYIQDNLWFKWELWVWWWYSNLFLGFIQQYFFLAMFVFMTAMSTEIWLQMR